MATTQGLRGAGSGEAARRHLAAGHAIHVSDPRFPGQVVRVHPDGQRELMDLDLEKGELVIVRELERR
jgi:hypothetical protein